MLGEDQEAAHQGEVGRPQQRRQTTHEREFEDNTSRKQALFAATPPLEALRMLLSATLSGNKPEMLMFSDTSRVYMYARTTSDTHVESCEEDKTELV